jgi:hypothetical protein
MVQWRTRVGAHQRGHTAEKHGNVPMGFPKAVFDSEFRTQPTAREPW